MLKNYINVTIRNILKHKFYSFLNILGLSVGVACFLLIILYVKDELSYDRHLPDVERMYRVDFTGAIGGNEFITSLSSVPAAAALLSDYPEVRAAVRFRQYGSRLMKPKGTTQLFKEESVIYADTNAISFFELPLLEGDAKTALVGPNKVAISETVARKFFGNETAVGKLIEVEGRKDFEVTAVFKDMPRNQHFHAHYLFSMESTDEAKSTAWMSFNFVTYIKLAEGSSPQALEAKFPAMVEKYIGPEVEKYMGQSMADFYASGNKAGFSLFPVTDIHLHSSKLGELEPNSDINYVYIFGAIAFFILMIACINFMNLATARSANRAKEVGVRKVLGAQRGLLIRQFLAEAMVMSFISFIIAYGLCFLLLPYFNELAEKQMLGNDLLTWDFISIMFVIMLAVGLLAGSYPSLYLSRFNPSEVLKGRLNLGMKSGRVRSVLVVFQFTMSIIMIVGTMVIYDQLSFIRNKNLGYNRDHVIIIRDAWLLKDRLEAFKTEALRNSAVKSGTISSFLPAGSSDNNNNLYFKGLNPENESHIVTDWRVDHDYVETFGMEILQGRNFSKEFPSDTNAIIVNEAFVRQFNLEEPIGETISGYSGTMENPVVEPYKIIGVVKDFHYASLRENIFPMLMFLGSSRGNISFKISGDRVDETIASLRQTWDEFGPGQPFAYNFLDQQFENAHKTEVRIGSIFIVFASLAVFIACLGLFGLAAFTAEQRNKEIGVRTVLGASVTSIMSLLSWEFVKLVGISFFIAAPLAYYAMGRWLDNFAFRTDLSISTVVLAGVLSLLVAWVTMSYQTWRAARANPVQSLRSE